MDSRSNKARFKSKLLESSLKFKFARENENLSSNEIVTNISKLQLFMSLFYTLKSRDTFSFEQFLRNTMPRQSLSKTEFESHIFSRTNLDICKNLVILFKSLIESCPHCRPFDFCFKCWTYLSAFFAFKPPPIPAIDHEDKQGKTSTELKRIKAVYCSLSGSVCGCNHPKSDKQSYFNWCDICCNSLEAKVDEPAEVQQIYTENRKYKFIFNSVDPLKKFIFSLPSCNSTCLKIKNLDIKKDKNNNNMYINLTNPRHCQDCRHLIKEFIPYSSQYFIDNISAELEIFKKTISVEKKVEVLVKKIEKDEFIFFLKKSKRWLRLEIRLRERKLRTQSKRQLVYRHPPPNPKPQNL